MPRQVTEASGSLIDLNTGQTLLALQEKWGFGNFIAGLKQTYGNAMPDHKAYKLMAIARRFEGRFEEVSFLSTTALHILSSPQLSDENLDYLLNEIREGRLTSKIKDLDDIFHLIVEHNISAKEAIALYQQGNKPGQQQVVVASKPTTAPLKVEPKVWEDLKLLSRSPTPALPTPTISSFTYEDERWLASNLAATREQIAAAEKVLGEMEDIRTLNEWLLERHNNVIVALKEFIEKSKDSMSRYYNKENQNNDNQHA